MREIRLKPQGPKWRGVSHPRLCVRNVRAPAPVQTLPATVQPSLPSLQELGTHQARTAATPGPGCGAAGVHTLLPTVHKGSVVFYRWAWGADIFWGTAAAGIFVVVVVVCVCWIWVWGVFWPCSV